MVEGKTMKTLRNIINWLSACGFHNFGIRLERSTVLECLKKVWAAEKKIKCRLEWHPWINYSMRNWGLFLVSFEKEALCSGKRKRTSLLRSSLPKKRLKIQLISSVTWNKNKIFLLKLFKVVSSNEIVLLSPLYIITDCNESVGSWLLPILLTAGYNHTSRWMAGSFNHCQRER